MKKHLNALVILFVVSVFSGALGVDTAAINTAQAFDYQAAGYPPPVSPVNISGTITSGGTAQQLAAANTNRRGWYIRNNSAGSLWVSDMTTAVQSQPSLEIKAGELYESVNGGTSLNALSIIGATTGQAWTGREW
jgi:hypothetical protein